MATELAWIIGACVASQLAAVAWSIRHVLQRERVEPMDESLEAKASELFALRAAARRTAGDIESLERDLWLDRVRFDDVVDGSNLADWRCLDCGESWSAVVKIPCKKCHPDALAALQAAWKREKAPESGATPTGGAASRN